MPSSSNSTHVHHFNADFEFKLWCKLLLDQGAFVDRCRQTCQRICYLFWPVRFCTSLYCCSRISRSHETATHLPSSAGSFKKVFGNSIYLYSLANGGVRGHFGYVCGCLVRASVILKASLSKIYLACRIALCFTFLTALVGLEMLSSSSDQILRWNILGHTVNKTSIRPRSGRHLQLHCHVREYCSFR